MLGKVLQRCDCGNQGMIPLEYTLKVSAILEEIRKVSSPESLVLLTERYR